MNDSESSCRAKARWKLLYKTIKGCKENDATDLYSTRIFSGYNLCNIKQLYEYISDGYSWFQYSLKKLVECKPVKIKILQNTTSAADLIGYDNTGNICVWPSEEVLAYYCIGNKNIFKDKSVCELGCGMTGLAGMLIAGNTECSKVLLTDGNERSVENLSSIIHENTQSFGKKEVLSDILRWGEDVLDFQSTHGAYDIVICADCLFYADVHSKLLETIHDIMKKEGICIIFAPRRSGTLQKFVDLAEQIFIVNLEENYDKHIWNLHEISCSNNLYSRDLHFPLLIKLFHKQ